MEITINTLSGIPLIMQSVPDSIHEQLMQIGENWKRDRWKIGDLTATLKAIIRERALNASIMDLYSAVAQMLNFEVSARTVEYYAAIAEFFPPQARAAYTDLPHSHFACAMSYGDQWGTVLGMSMDYLEKHGRPPSVEWLKTQMGQPQAPETPEGYEPPETSPEESEIPGAEMVQPLAEAAVKTLRPLSDRLEYFGYPEDLVQEIRVMIARLEAIC